MPLCFPPCAEKYGKKTSCFHAPPCQSFGHRSWKTISRASFVTKKERNKLISPKIGCNPKTAKPSPAPQPSPRGSVRLQPLQRVPNGIPLPFPPSLPTLRPALWKRPPKRKATARAHQNHSPPLRVARLLHPPNTNHGAAEEGINAGPGLLHPTRLITPAPPPSPRRGEVWKVRRSMSDTYTESDHRDLPQNPKCLPVP